MTIIIVIQNANTFPEHHFFFFNKITLELCAVYDLYVVFDYYYFFWSQRIHATNWRHKNEMREPCWQKSKPKHLGFIGETVHALHIIKQVLDGMKKKNNGKIIINNINRTRSFHTLRRWCKHGISDAPGLRISGHVLAGFSWDLMHHFGRRCNRIEQFENGSTLFRNRKLFRVNSIYRLEKCPCPPQKKSA